MWSDRRSLLLALPVLLAGCGFEPVYGPGGTGTALYDSVEFATPGSREDFLYVQQLGVSLGRSQAPEYRLAYAIGTLDTGQAVTSTGDITRYNLIGEVDYVLTRIADETVVAEGRVDNFAGYSATGSTVDTLAAERDAVRRLMIILADQTAQRLFLTVDTGP